jgi:membrane protein
MAYDAEGRAAERPRHIPARGWMEVLKRVWKESSDDNLGLVAAGVAFYGMLAIFPAIAAVVSIWGVFADPVSVQAQISSVLSVLPPDAAQILKDQVTSVARGENGALTIAALVSLGITLYSSAKGTNAIINGLNVAYEEKERRPWWKLLLTSLGLTLAAILVAIVALSLVAVLPAVLEMLGLGSAGETLINVLRWPFLGLCVAGYLAVLYRFAPSRDKPKWRWTTPGALGATVLWLVGSGLFSLYVGQFGNYNETYGTLGAVVVLLTWLWLSSYVVLLGAELDAELENQTGRDTTTGPEKPMGQRGAFVADNPPPPAPS